MHMGAESSVPAVPDRHELARALERSRRPESAPGARFLDGLSERPPPAPERERRLVLAAQEGDARARAELVEAFMPRIASIAGVYRATPTVDRLELLQEGVAGLLRALERYDADSGVPFWVYARWLVRRSMQRLVAELTRPAVLSDHALRRLARIEEGRREAHAQTGREPTYDELVARSGLSPEEVSSLLAVDRVPRSIHEPLTTADGAVWGTLEDLLDDPVADGEYERVLDAIEAQELVGLLSSLSDRERFILRARYGLDGEEQTLSQIGERLGLSSHRVSKIERRALGKLAAAAGADAAS
jgi:RNA polymerase primary sigma factor